MYTSRPGLILGFHGTDASVVSKVVSQTQPLQFNNNSWDWLGHGAYFWEHSHSRAMEYAQTAANLLYPDAGFREKNHIQICVRNPNCIKGFFIPRNLADFKG